MILVAVVRKRYKGDFVFIVRRFISIGQATAPQPSNNNNGPFLDP